MATSDFAGRLQALLDQVWTLRPSWERPETFHECKSEVIAGLKALIVAANTGVELAPSIAVRATTMLRRPEPPQTPSEPPEAPVELTPAAGGSNSVPEPTGEAATRLPSPAADATGTPPTDSPRTPTLSDAEAELLCLQQAIHNTVGTVLGVFADVEKLALAVHSSAAAYTAALGGTGGALTPTLAADKGSPAAAPTPPAGNGSSVPPAARLAAKAPARVPVPSSLPPRPPPLPPDGYSFTNLRTEAGQWRAARLWAAGYRQIDIAKHFGGKDASCVSVAVDAFLKRVLGRRSIDAYGEARKVLIRQVLDRPETRVPTSTMSS
jgi:hypothetical protein